MSCCAGAQSRRCIFSPISIIVQETTLQVPVQDDGKVENERSSATEGPGQKFV